MIEGLTKPLQAVIKLLKDHPSLLAALGGAILVILAAAGAIDTIVAVVAIAAIVVLLVVAILVSRAPRRVIVNEQQATRGGAIDGSGLDVTSAPPVDRIVNRVTARWGGRVRNSGTRTRHR